MDPMLAVWFGACTASLLLAALMTLLGGSS